MGSNGFLPEPGTGAASHLRPVRQTGADDGPSQHVRTQFAVLGPLRLTRDGVDHTPQAPKVRQVLALLVLRANQTVHTESLVDELWGEDPPRSAQTTLQTYVYHLRRLFQHRRLAGHGECRLVTRSPGYALLVDPDVVDLQHFLALSAEGQRDQAHGRLDRASERLREGLAMWTDAPLANVRLGPQLLAYVVDLQEQKRAIHRAAIEADVTRGRYQALIGELRALIAQYPLDEWLHIQLMIALDHSGRRSDAIDVYHGLRGTLGDELGLDPSPQVQEVHHRVLGA